MPLSEFANKNPWDFGVGKCDLMYVDLIRSLDYKIVPNIILDYHNKIYNEDEISDSEKKEILYTRTVAENFY